MPAGLTRKWWIWLPHALVVFWLMYLAITIWQHVAHSVQPPLYDPLSYIQKAMNFWRAVEQGVFANPLNIEPTTRPPGTILLTYPFGFTLDIRGFLFRSVFVGIFCVVLAVYIAAGLDQARKAGWSVAAIALLLSALPMFYHFDTVEANLTIYRWAMVDGFQAGIAALAAATMIRSLVSRSQGWLFCSALLAAFTLLVKPSGLMVMLLLAATWMLAISFEWWQAGRLQSDGPRVPDYLRGYLLSGVVNFSLVYVSVGLLCVFSGYLSQSNFAYARQALVVMREVLAMSAVTLFLALHQSLGEALMVWLAGTAALFIAGRAAITERRDTDSRRALGLLAGSLFILCLGAWYWLVVQAGGKEVRYFFPFLLMGAICMVPAAQTVWSQANRQLRALILALCWLPALNIAGLLAAGDNPPNWWQELTGVSVTVGVNREEVEQATEFLEDIRKTKRSVDLYSFSGSVVTGVFECVGMYEALVRPELASFHPTLPFDWARGFAIRIADLNAREYILIGKPKDADATVLLNTRTLGTFELEQTAFEAWLWTLNPMSGVEIASDGRALRLLRVSDRGAFEQAIQGFVADRLWRPEFIEANKAVELVARTMVAQSSDLAAQEIRFGDLYVLHALWIKPVGEQLKIDVWWEALKHQEGHAPWYLFMHLVDASGAILLDRQIVLAPEQSFGARQGWKHGEVTFTASTPEKKATAFAFGIYQHDGDMLAADKGRTDWQGKRVRIPLSRIDGERSDTAADGKR